jgi:hypothetical protein
MKKMISLLMVVVGFMAASEAYADAYTFETHIDMVAVNEGGDATNSGLTCISTTTPALAECNGFIAIPNGNKQLLAAALQAKATNSNTWIYYKYGVGVEQHCPGIVHTPCSVISIGVK